MDRIVLTISSELFDDNPRHEASIRTNTTVRGLIDEIRREFNLLDGNYSLTLKGSNKPLESDKTLDQLGVLTGSELIFERERRRLSQQIVARGGQYFQPISGSVHGSLYDIEWQPAVIGRADAANPASAQRLAVDLGELPEARTVSRQHARITERGGQYFLEGLAERNPTLLNDRELTVGEKRALKPGDKIRVGKIVLTFSTQP
jgi:hypothetical protein